MRLRFAVEGVEAPPEQTKPQTATV